MTVPPFSVETPPPASSPQPWKLWAATRARTRADAEDLIHDYGADAEMIAARLARSERRRVRISFTLPPGHWGRVWREIRRHNLRHPIRVPASPPCADDADPASLT